MRSFHEDVNKGKISRWYAENATLVCCGDVVARECIEEQWGNFHRNINVVKYTEAIPTRLPPGNPADWDELFLKVSGT
jgi:hypothetical protein